MNAIGERLAQIHANRVALAGAHPRIVFIEPCATDEAERRCEEFSGRSILKLALNAERDAVEANESAQLLCSQKPGHDCASALGERNNRALREVGAKDVVREFL